MLISRVSSEHHEGARPSVTAKGSRDLCMRRCCERHAQPLRKASRRPGGSPRLSCPVPPAGWFHEQADDRARKDKLNIRTEPSGAMPAAPAMKELAAVRTQLRKHVLKIGCGGGGGAQRGWVERSTREREQRKSEQAASDFEATVDDVLVGHAITGEMEWRTQCQGGKPRANERAHRRTRRDMERHDHECPAGGLARPRCRLRCSAGAGPASPNRVPSESRQIAQCTPGWTTCPTTQILIGRGLLASRGLFWPFRLSWCLLLGLGERLRTLLPGHVGLLPLDRVSGPNDSTCASDSILSATTARRFDICPGPVLTARILQIVVS
jgi:hypothetical protein